MKTKRLWCLLTVLWCLVLTASAQNSDVNEVPDTVEMEDLVITPSRRETALKDVPVQMTRITREQLQNSPDMTVDEYLRRIPDIATKRTFIAECGPGREMTLRGVPEQRRTLVMVDGIPMNEGYGGSVNWSLIPKEAVESIEIVHGPMSALYGSGAMGGVINIITRKSKEPSKTQIKASYGTFNTTSASVHQSGWHESLGYWGHARFYDTDGYMKIKTPQSYHVDNERTDWNLLGKLYYDLDDQSSLAVGGHAVKEDYSRGRLYTNQHNKAQGGDVTYRRELLNGGTLTAGLYGNYNYRYVEDGGSASAALDHTEENDMYRVGQLFQLGVPLDDIHYFTWGIDSTVNFFEKENLSPTGIKEADADGQQILVSVFAQDEMTWQIGDVDTLIATVGLRGDYCQSRDGSVMNTDLSIDEDYGSDDWASINPKLGLVYQHQDTTLRGGLGTSFAAPTLSAQYTVFSRGVNRYIGNPDLDPETSMSYNLGLEQRLTPNLSVSVDGYYTKAKDFLSTKEVSANTFQYDNISDVQIWGVDLECRWRMTSELTGYVGGLYNESTVLEDDESPANKGNDVAFQPRRSGRIGLTYQGQQGTTVDLSARYVGERYYNVSNSSSTLLDDYVSLDLYVSQRLNSHAEAFLGLENILDEKYRVYSLPSEDRSFGGSYAPGLLVTGGFKIEL